MSLNPLDLPGQQFLILFILLGVASMILSNVLQRRAGPPGDTRALTLNPFEAAYLAGGERAALDTAIASLFRRGLLDTEGTPPSMTTRSDQPPPFDLHPLEREAHATIARVRPSGRADLAAALGSSSELTALRARLESLGLRFKPGEYARHGLFAALPVVAVALLGAAKVSIGLRLGRPVLFLVVLLIIVALYALRVMISAPPRTRRGAAALREVRDRHAALESSAKTAARSLGPSELAMAFALFGPAVLVGSEFDVLRPMITPPASSGGSSCSGSSSSSDGGGGDSGGDSGGGSGCGGCGGGGGD